ncbi:MAG: putative enoyl-CoA hydratase [Solirubrobacterales bacterium]|nr:putative enoyl-CoA hydratase [Solirubrobacterales bacterium]
MSSLDPRTPVLVGAGQISHKAPDGPVPSTPELLELAARAALRDVGEAGPELAARAGIVAVVDLFSWTVPDPAAALARSLGITPNETVLSARGGNGPIGLLGALSTDIQEGRVDVTLIAGGEAMTPFMKAVKSGEGTGWPTQPEGTTPSRIVGVDREPGHPAELAAGLIAPVFWYPMFEQAVRRSEGRTQAEHQEHLGALWARFAAVAANNPYAWSRDAPDAAAIAHPSPSNRQVSAPYTKLMNANIQVDQAAALVLCSVQAARDAGIPEDRWVYVTSTAGAHDHWFGGERADLGRSPAIAAVGTAALGHAGLGIDDVDHLDLYSCFPVAVQVAARELGVDLTDETRAPTVTGGLTFAGGPANAYVVHSLATLVTRLRGRSGEHALATAVGWYLTKHGAAILSSDPPSAPFAALDVQNKVDMLPSRSLTTAAIHAAPVETYTAIYDHTGEATMAIVSVLDKAGDRGLAKSHDPAVIAAFLDGDPLERTVDLDGEADFTVSA